MLKSNRGAAKRFKVTASGKVKRKKAYLRHLLSSKTQNQKRHLKKHGAVSEDDMVRMLRLLPFSF
jgi:large subunit ribosomal protein L35